MYIREHAVATKEKAPVGHKQRESENKNKMTAERERNGGKPSLDLKWKGNNIIMMENTTRSCYCGTKEV